MPLIIGDAVLITSGCGITLKLIVEFINARIENLTKDVWLLNERFANFI